MLNTSFPAWPSFSQEEIDAVARVLASGRVNFWTGSECRSFENEFAAWCGVKYAIAMANGTLALDAALAALKLAPGDEVVVTPRTFLASVSTVVMAGGRPVFADLDRETQNITADTIARVLSPRTKAILCVHLGGMPCDLDPILELAEKSGIRVIEDCAQAHGALYKGRSVGGIGHIGAWSFCQDKIITTGGEGGMVTTNDPSLWSSMWSWKDHGKSHEACFARAHPPGFRWLHEGFGTNARMLEMQAVIGRIQLGRLATWSKARRAAADKIWTAARSIRGLRAPMMPAWAQHAAYKCYVFVEPDALASGWNRDRIQTEIEARQVPCYSGSCSEVYLEKAFDGTDWRPASRLPVAKELGETSLMFLVHPTLRDADIDRTCEVLGDVMARASR